MACHPMCVPGKVVHASADPPTVGWRPHEPPCASACRCRSEFRAVAALPPRRGLRVATCYRGVLVLDGSSGATAGARRLRELVRKR
eukprot:scaffold34506_cov31-Tisochrysis_lutea.AAC.2